jgi:hypothetical protein
MIYLDQNLYLLGWGLDEESIGCAGNSPTLKMGRMDLIPDSICKEWHDGYPLSITHNNTCAAKNGKNMTEGTGACHVCSNLIICFDSLFLFRVTQGVVL